MQILFGAHETIIKINSKSMNIEYIQHYISTHFTQRVIYSNSIKIPASTQNIYHRTFLLKWLYSLYAKKNRPLPELKESLLKRHHKAIKIILPQKIVHSIFYKIIDDRVVHISISPQNNNIALKIKTFLQAQITIMPTYLQITFKSEDEKERLKLFLGATKIINIPHKHIYNKEKMDQFFKTSQEKVKKEEISQLEHAYMVLEMNPTDDIKSIKKQYKLLAKEFHPDRVSNGNAALIEHHTKKFQKLLESYEIIWDNLR